MRLIGMFRLKLRSLFRRTAVEQELDEELRYHVERQVEENAAAGMSREEARHAALRSIEGLEQRKEECRDMRGLSVIDNLRKDLRFALRQCFREATFRIPTTWTGKSGTPSSARSTCIKMPVCAEYARRCATSNGRARD